MKLSLLFIILFLITTSAFGEASSCDFNWDRTEANWRTGAPASSTPRASPSGRNSQGYVEDFDNRLLDRPYAAMGAVGNFFIGNESCSNADRSEFVTINCSGNAGNGYHYDLDSLNIEGLVNYWDEESEELVFLTAINGVHEFATCQEGLFRDYFGNQQHQSDLQRNAHAALNQVVAKYYEMEDLRRTRDQTGTHASDEWIDEEIGRFVSRVPMGNRDIMREAMVQLLKYHTPRNPNDFFGRREVPFETFQQVFHEKMTLMSNQTQNTLRVIEGPIRNNGQRTGGIVRHLPDGKTLYCVNTELKTYLWRSGQIDTAVSQYQAREELTPGFMCRSDNRYGRIGGYTAEIALIPTYFLGYGAARLAARAGLAGFRAATTTGDMVTGTRMVMLGLEGANWLAAGNAISNDCNMEEMFANVNGSSCNPETELNRVYEEASLSQCLTTAFIGAASIFAGPAARIWNSRGLARAEQLLEESNQIVVTAARRTRTPSTSNIPEPESVDRTGYITRFFNWLRGDTAPLTFRNEIDSAAVGRQTARDEAALTALGVETRQVWRTTYLEGNVRLFNKQTLTNVGEGAPNYGKILMVTDLPPPGTATGPGVNAFVHPEMAAYQARLEAMGIDLVVDTSTNFGGAGAYFWGHTRVLALRPNSTWQTFLHEFQHVQFDRFVAPNFQRMQQLAISNRPIESALTAEQLTELGPQRVARLQELLTRELPVTAVNETLSVEQELAALGLRRYLPFVGSGSRSYALRHQITELERIPATSRTAVQQQELERANRELTLIRGYETTATVVGGAAIVAVPGAVGFGGVVAYKEYGDDIGDFRQLFFNERTNKPVMGQKTDGSWVRFEEPASEN